MSTIRYIPINTPVRGHSYLFHVELAHKGNGDWIAWVEALPGCAAWGFSHDEVLNAVHALAQTYVRRIIAQGLPVPTGGEAVNTPMIAVTL